MAGWRKTVLGQEGNGIPLVVASALVVLFLFCGISEYARLNLIAAGVRDAVQEAILSTINSSYGDVYRGVCEGYSGGHYPSRGGWDESLDYGDVHGFLDDFLRMEGYGSYHVERMDGGRREKYRISDLDVIIQNVPLTSDSSERFLADATFLLRIPVHFGESHLSDMQICMKV